MHTIVVYSPPMCILKDMDLQFTAMTYMQVRPSKAVIETLCANFQPWKHSVKSSSRIREYIDFDNYIVPA